MFPSPASTTPDWSAEYTSGNGMGVGIAPSARQVAVTIGASSVRTFSPFRSSMPRSGFRAYTPRVPPV